MKKHTGTVNFKVSAMWLLVAYSRRQSSQDDRDKILSICCYLCSNQLFFLPSRQIKTPIEFKNSVFVSQN